MKKIFISWMLLAGISSFAQEAGKAGELLKNEVSKMELNLQPPKSKILEMIIQLILQDSEIQIIRIIQTKDQQTQITNGIIITDMRKFF